ncbi:MAG: hypothetical protein F6J94_27245 [Moorea sp. SIO1F2]|uniref:hypothetical protein n=1 Tax=Moorena sp. SIO1F2 TaxID=2607819 RepID=UPI0013BE6076|nr:hypothetical protein [Moorena sp. SIO1F2]NET85464.1 hypothetical protein [Moorena sp. SIO1F2]
MVLYVISIQAGATITRNVIPIFQSIDFFQKSGTGNFGSGNSGQELTQTVLPTPDSRLPTPVPLLGGVRGGFRLPGLWATLREQTQNFVPHPMEKGCISYL